MQRRRGGAAARRSVPQYALAAMPRLVSIAILPLLALLPRWRAEADAEKSQPQPHPQPKHRWPWMGETTVDGWLAKDSVDLSDFLTPLVDLGLEAVEDLLLIEHADLLQMGMSPREALRFEKGVIPIMLWQEHQEEYTETWGSAAVTHSGAAPDPTASAPDRAPDRLWGVSSAARWLDRPVSSLLGFMDQSQHLVTESGQMNFATTREIQEMKALVDGLEDALVRMRARLGPQAYTLSVRDVLNLQRQQQHDSLIHRKPPKSGGMDTVAHVRQSIRRANMLVSRAPAAALELEGMSSDRVRHLLNNLCSRASTSYLEVGSWKGSTLAAALANNDQTRAVAIDDFSEYGSSKAKIMQNLNAVLRLDRTATAAAAAAQRVQFLEADAFASPTLTMLAEIAAEGRPFDVYLYDGSHDYASHIAALTQFLPVLASVFVLCVDDWNFPHVRAGTRAAFDALSADLDMLYETELPARFNGDKDLWWNGMLVAVFQKRVDELLDDTAT